MYARILPLLLCLALPAAGCDILAEPPSDPVCDAGPEPIAVLLDSEAPEDPVGADLVVQGRIERVGRTAVRRVTVAGIPALSRGFNFESWSVTVPLSTLRALAASSTVDGVGTATLSILAEDACGARGEASLEVRVRAASGAILGLSLSVSAPDPALSFIPADGRTPGLVRISAEPSGAGATVTLSTSLGLLDGSADPILRVLSLDTEGRASATALLRSDRAGAASVSATGGALRADGSIAVVGPPSFAPAGGTLRPGQAIVVVARSEGLLSECEASITGAFSITYGGVALTAASLAVGDDRADLRVEALPSTEPTEALLRCRDPYGQSGSVRFENTP